MNINEAYRQLELEDHISFQSKQMKYHLDNIRNNKELLSSEEMHLKEAFLYMRQTGRTTYKCVDAAIRILSGKNVMILVQSLSQSKRIKEKIKNYTWTLGQSNKVDYINVGRLEIKTGSTIDKINESTRGWDGDIIIDIY